MHYISKTGLRTTLLIGTVALAAFSFAGIARADNVETVVVTGSRIPQANLQSVSPILGVAAKEFEQKGATDVAEAVRKETGLRTAFHHHCAGYVEIPAEIEKLMSLTDPGLLGLVFDCGHYRLGGGDPEEGLRKYGQRVWHFHFKDHQPKVAQRAAGEGWDYFQAVEHGVFCELGKGDVNFPALMNQLQEFGYDGWGVVEQDVLPGMGAPKESAKRNRDYIRSLGF